MRGKKNYGCAFYISPENKKLIKPRTEGFALMIRDWDDVIIMSSAERVGVISITSTKVNGLH